MATETASRPALGAAAALSIGAGFVHAAVIGHHTEHEQLALLFVAAAVFQVGWGFLALWRPSRLLALVGLAGNLGAAVFWLVTRTSSVGWIDGLEQKESVAFTDAATAGLGLAAAVAAALALVSRPAVTRALSLAPVAAVATLLAVPAVVATATDVGSHSHGEEAGHDDAGGAAHEHTDGAAAAGLEQTDGAAATEHEHADGATAAEHDHADGAAATEHDHADDATTADGAGVDASGVEHGTEGHDHSTMWPRAWNPKQPIDLTGVAGVTKAQRAYGTALVAETMRDLPHFADPATAAAEGYRSIGDERSGYEHYINYGYISDGKMLDSTAPESIVYKVDGEKRIVASAMYIAEPDYPFGSEQLDTLMGGLVTWHNHDNLCWKVVNGEPKVAAVTDDHGGQCPEGTVHAGGNAAMVHVWITSHPCGVFSALEGHGAGQSFDRGQSRVDQCGAGHDHGGTGQQAVANWPRPYDGSTIDISGVPGVTPEQEQYATGLIKRTERDLPKYADQQTALDEGYFSIGDAATGDEHLVNPAYFADGKMLDPTAPESLVYKAEGDKRTLAGAMYTAEPEYDLGSKKLNSVLGNLADWHVHTDVCFEGGKVAGLADENGNCPVGTNAAAADLPMVHVWIEPHQCGPFAALEGIGAGQVAENEAERVDMCNSAEHQH